ncbi:P-loop containing nucleoside triphosphate hydrolase protein [Amniculicola lignicola CBS 123094]|uniref:P-loop containing nucleoside triphosphate hydrolase protein n=1 Tax=Amniculicola lignicola CBS 123094 TaxID=1392246 RepID=A0A6A5VXN6_9PLEO|nr:P-loop containing nucleoside triphosphate hydrolase protein [Amniculicola lignicola CBS 123094]
MIPRPNTNPSRFDAAVDTRAFFQIGWNLIETEDAGIHQYIITKLGAETGLAIVKALTESMDVNQEAETTLSIFTDRTLPFYRIISHPDVLSSLVLETPIDTIYTFLFGPGGRRCLRVFRFTASALSEMVFGYASSNEESSIIAISSSLAVLNRLIEINQSAQVLEGLSAIVETISGCIPEAYTVPNVQQNLTRIRRRLNIGSSLPLVSTQSTRQIALPAAFELSQDLPGNLSKNGARHDNDHASISNIRILPTALEITSTRPEYIPTIDSTQHHLTGLACLLDRQFRLLREDTVGQLRDAVREEVTRLNHPTRNISTTHQDQQGVRKLIYHNVRFSCMTVDRRRGLQVVAEFDQPAQVKKKSAKQREDWWKGSKLLQVDSLVCFVSSHGKIIFLTVCDSILPSHRRKDPDLANKGRPDNRPNLFGQPNSASVLLCLAEYKTEDAHWISTHIGPSKTRQSLVEFPGVLLPSFQPTLQALQKMSRTLDLPFAEIIAPDAQTPAGFINPPAYATKRNFSFNLDILAGVSITLNPAEPFDFAKLAGSTLDQGQQFAVVQALSAGLALVQGPPGTGKSYTGEAIIKILLHNRKLAKLGPILCVCYTNHALDQLLEHLVNGGVKQVIRLGSRSKSEILQNLTLHKVSKEVLPTKTEKHDKWEHNRAIGDTIEELGVILSGLNSPLSLTNIQAHLMRTHDKHYEEMFTKRVDEEGFQEVKDKKVGVVDSWLRGAPKGFTSNRPVSALLAVPLREMSTSERTILHKHWTEQRSAQLANDLIWALDSYRNSKSALDNCHSELDLRCLREAHVIGVTTSGLARNIELLQRVRAKVMLCEEAGEVLEAHTLTAILPGIEHAILIGDHEQLRPQINNFELQHDNPRGKKYSLDVSLFERLVKPRTGNLQIPLSTLKIQRRMHPSISELVRASLYPDLRDHPSVSEYPEVDGMRDRLYWLDHQEKEDPRAAQAVSLSRTNTWEVEMVASLVSHLVRQGTYGSEDIAIITPYLGQLQKIKKRLANTFEIVVGDRDQEELDAEGLQDEPEGASTDGQIQIKKTTLLNALRIATVDNFQGEEAKVIVVSLVRSNPERKCGFLKTSNRINVLLSRARHGMYIIGNSDTSRPVPMWAKVLTILERSHKIGPSLALCCARHKETPIEVSMPDDFARLAPEGGCSKRCSSRLRCGHSCPNMCHSGSLHNAVRCLERCPRTKNGCEHACPRPCGDQCELQCQVVLFNIPLPCGHIATHLKCHEAQAPEKARCHAQVEQIMKHCKHKVRVRCCELPLGDDYACSATCGAALTCGHDCNYACRECNIPVGGGGSERKHGRCNTRCGRPYTTCSHSCKIPCHGNMSCPLCTEPCEIRCSHSRCSKLCHEPCVPCAEDCSWSCPHRGRCPLPCAVPCDMLPCSERCKNVLACGHQCPSICGEVCPGVAFCQICAHPDIKATVVDFILSSTFEEVDLDTNPCIIPPCGHTLTLESMDGHMSMSDFYVSNVEGSIVALKNSSKPFSAFGMKSCPTCRAPLRNLNRYSRIVRRALIDEATKKFIVWANKEFIPLVNRMQAIEAELRETDGSNQTVPERGRLKTPVSEPLQLRGTRDQQISQIGRLMRKEKPYKTLANLRRDIRRFLEQVNEREQPFGRIYDLVQDARRHRGINIDLRSNADILQVRNRLLTTVLLIRCDYTILLAFLRDRKGESGADSPSIQVDFSTNRKDCEELISEAHERKQPGNLVEGHLYWARFFALERTFTERESQLTQHLALARMHLSIAREVCDKHPGQTGGMRNELEDIEKSLRDSTFYMPVSNEEKAAVYAAMANDFRGTGHWYYCENGHPFTIGECGMPMETSQCPQCGSPVGGENHEAVGGVRRATDLERDFGGLSM